MLSRSEESGAGRAVLGGVEGVGGVSKWEACHIIGPAHAPTRSAGLKG